MITEDYVSYELAKLLKEKGFNELCNHYYFYKKLKEVNYYEKNSDGEYLEEVEYCTAPTHQMALKWLREVHKIFIEVSVSIDLNGEYHYSYFILDKKCKYIRKGFTDFDWNYEEAVEAAIKYSLKILI